jgi:hypothetical protein
MNTMVLTRPTERHGCRVRLTAEPAAAAEARRQVRAAIQAWPVPVDPDVAVLLTSDLVTNAIRHQAGGTLTLNIRWARGRLLVEVLGTTADAEAWPGLILIAALSDDWGSYRTPWGRATYFTLAFTA